MNLKKLKVSSTSSITGPIHVATTTIILPDVQRFFASILLSIGTITISAGNFKNDNGVTVSSLPSPPISGYYNVYLNGNLQPAGSVSLTTTSIIVTSSLAALTSVVIEVVNLTNTTSNSTATSALTVSTNILT